MVRLTALMVSRRDAAGNDFQWPLHQFHVAGKIGAGIRFEGGCRRRRPQAVV
jgi:hypothetical protein